MIKIFPVLFMRPLMLFVLFFCGSIISGQHILIHSHNDYQQAEPLVNALRNRAYSIEADIYLVNDTLKVAHDKRELPTAPSLSDLYIQPIVKLFKLNQGHISSDHHYAPVLMIDIKDNGEAALTALTKMLSQYPSVFDRLVNPKAVQVVISGDRGDRSKWTSCPSFILFDGRMSEQYTKEQLERVAFVSDSYVNYAKQTDSTTSLIKQLADRTHQMKKLLRLWAIPDNKSSWQHLRGLGVDIINTDKVAECRKYFDVKE